MRGTVQFQQSRAATMPERGVTKAERVLAGDATRRSNIYVEEADMTSAISARIDGKGGIAHA